MHNSQEVSNTIKAQAKKRLVSIGDMLAECGLSKNTLSSMQSGGYLPRTENIAKIADYLDCSVDYLLGRTDNEDLGDTEQEKELLKAYRSNPAMQGAVKTLLGITPVQPAKIHKIAVAAYGGTGTQVRELTQEQYENSKGLLKELRDKQLGNKN